MIGETCSHGIPWTEDCPQCNLVWARDTVERLGPVVDEARAVIEAAEQTTEGQT
jgi:hypothetical protein